MKPIVLGAIALFGSSPLLAAEQLPACMAKRAEIERGISAAEAQGNVREARGLRKALRANIDRCTTASLEAERSRDIAEAEEEVAERQADLARAERKGDAEKIAKQKAKLEEARQELSEARQPLSL